MIKIYFDGACEGSDPTGLLTYGYRIINHNGVVLENVGGAAWIKSPPSTVSIAEYYAMIEGLKKAFKMGISYKPILVLGDSKLVIEQTFGNWQLRKGPYIPWALKAKKLVEKFTDISGTWIPRDENWHCDQLARVAWEKRNPERKRRMRQLTTS